MTIFDELKARGLLAQLTDEEEIKELINAGKATFYIGFDPTADSLHVGHFMALCLMKRLQEAGNKPIALIGGATAMIGDPSGRSDMRSMMTKETIEHNVECFKKQMSRFIDFSDGKAIMVNNADWLLDLNYVDVLREDSVKTLNFTSTNKFLLGEYQVPEGIKLLVEKLVPYCEEITVVAPLVEMGDKLLARDGCLNFFAGPIDSAFSAKFNFYNVHYASTHIAGTSGGNTDDMNESLDMMAKGKINPAAMITHIGGLTAAKDATLNLPNIKGGKKLIYTHIDMPLTAISDFEKLGETDPLFKQLAEITKKNNNLWCKEAEDVLLDTFGVK